MNLRVLDTLSTCGEATTRSRQMETWRLLVTCRLVLPHVVVAVPTHGPAALQIGVLCVWVTKNRRCGLLTDASSGQNKMWWGTIFRSKISDPFISLLNIATLWRSSSVVIMILIFLQFRWEISNVFYKITCSRISSSKSVFNLAISQFIINLNSWFQGSLFHKNLGTLGVLYNVVFQKNVFPIFICTVQMY